MDTKDTAEKTAPSLGFNPRQGTSNTRCLPLDHCLVVVYMFQQA